jgi:hypothetical protein
MSYFSAVNERRNKQGGVFGKRERFGGCVGVKFGWIGVRFEKGCMKNGVKARKIRWKR